MKTFSNLLTKENELIAYSLLISLFVTSFSFYIIGYKVDLLLLSSLFSFLVLIINNRVLILGISLILFVVGLVTTKTFFLSSGLLTLFSYLILCLYKIKSETLTNAIRKPLDYLLNKIPFHIIHPDVYSCFSIVAGVIALFCSIQLDNPTCFIITLLISLLFDVFDGTSARQRAKLNISQISERGKIVDIISDKTSSVFFLAASLIYLNSGSIIIIVSILSIWSVFQLVFSWAGGGILVRHILLALFIFQPIDAFVIISLLVAYSCYKTIGYTYKYFNGGRNHYIWNNIDLSYFVRFFMYSILIINFIHFQIWNLHMSYCLLYILFFSVIHILIRRNSKVSLIQLSLFIARLGIIGASIFLLNMAIIELPLIFVGMYIVQFLISFGIIMVSTQTGLKKYSISTYKAKFKTIKPNYSEVFPKAFAFGINTIIINETQIQDSYEFEKIKNHELLHLKRMDFLRINLLEVILHICFPIIISIFINFLSFTTNLSFVLLIGIMLVVIIEEFINKYAVFQDIMVNSRTK